MIRTIPDEWIGFRICTHCGAKMEEGYYLSGDYACSRECAIALYEEYYESDEAQFELDIEEEMDECGSTDCFWTSWYDEK